MIQILYAVFVKVAPNNVSTDRSENIIAEGGIKNGVGTGFTGPTHVWVENLGIPSEEHREAIDAVPVLLFYPVAVKGCRPASCPKFEVLDSIPCPKPTYSELGGSGGGEHEFHMMGK